MNLNRAELERIFLAGDVDRNSELDGDECIPMRATLRKTLQEMGDLLHKKYDSNNDGKLSGDEAVFLARNEFGLSDSDATKEFTLSDQNVDHWIAPGAEMSELMLNLRARQVIGGGTALSVGK
ncbi:unnamed protein product [Strongylus vulgaris]|uniref:EF-hand domain-containing protein n=1 Tax=Strongylus vulgaris TaxID=40348 RepID=A0A3P7L1G6_STRVU|nr:unnamed protein product [Strongylus vulgaris]